MGFTYTPSFISSKCRWGPVALPVWPTSAMGSPGRPHLLAGGGVDAAAMGIQGDKAPGVLHRHIIAQLRAVSHRRDGPGGKGRDHRPLVGGDVQAVVELLSAAVGVLSIAEPVRHRSGQRVGIGKAQHLLGQAHVPGGVLRRIGRRVRRVLGNRDPGILGAEHRRVGVVQRLPHGALAGYRPAHGGKRRPEVRLPGHQVQQPVPVPVHSRRGRDLHHHHRQQQHRTDGQLGQAAVPPPGGGLLPLAPGRRRRRPVPPGGPRSVCHSAFPLFGAVYAPGGGDRTENRVNLSLLAGTIANPADGTISGVAPQAQLVVMKVFGDNSTGAAEDDILAALEDS